MHDEPVTSQPPPAGPFAVEHLIALDILKERGSAEGNNPEDEQILADLAAAGFARKVDNAYVYTGSSPDGVVNPAREVSVACTILRDTRMHSEFKVLLLGAAVGALETLAGMVALRELVFGCGLWAAVVPLLLPLAAVFDWRNMRPGRFERRNAEWQRNPHNPFHMPLEPDAWLTRYGNLILVATLYVLPIVIMAILR
jgi:hypothetical protein